MKSSYLAIILTLPVFFAFCENPADKTTNANVATAVEKTNINSECGVKYVFAPTSEIHFIGSKVTGSDNGGFKAFAGYFTIKDGAPVGNDHKVVIDMSSTWADHEKLTGHLKSPDFFNVEKFPQATFDVTSVSKKSSASYEVSGNFTLHSKTKNINFPATVLQNGDNVKIDATFDINRKDFDIVYAGKVDDLIREEVVIKLQLEAKPEA